MCLENKLDNGKKILKDIFKVVLHCVCNVFTFFNTVSYLKLNSKLKIDPKMCTLKNLEEIWKTWKKFGKTKDNPERSSYRSIDIWCFICATLKRAFDHRHC